MSKILTKAEEIRQWVEARGGYPIMMDVPDGTKTRTLLQFTFGQHFLNADENEGPDRPYGYELVSWDEWLAELEKQDLALKVSDDPSGGNEQEYQIIGRHDDRNTV
jgi:hypothetical protein